ncbi:MAG: cytochrome c4 [Gammaproteobacteria bacterium]|nr:cytochrome c4 [Gammaproteobacteria bacterium]MBU1601318.1 cytochrome c4 [Gammaproteobacteria bacterium]MBU2433899.1 cytochrome c4 [Gammaproteobacteria bacterium]MBU2450583.1 cytochrome c4 [Gammaproteobacteria bacterium]
MRALIFLAGCLLSASVWAQSTPQASAAQERLKALGADPVALRAAIDAGKKATFFCANCHGEDGISKTPDVPNLAGQNPAYLLEQIRKFSVGERKDPFMQGLIKVLKDEERIQVAHYYASVKVPPSVADNSLVPHGKELFTKLCVRCHGEQARGNELFPRLAGQKVPYLKTSITRYRDMTGVRNNQLMSIATAPLKNEDITAIANYLTQMR